MIRKNEWFRRRKYTGWGFTPVTWQGWVYIAIEIAPLILLASFGPISQARMILIIAWALIVCIDYIDIMLHLPKDERDMIHEAIAERNALWVVIAILIIGIGYQTASGAVQGIWAVDPIIIIALVGALITKTISNMYLDRRN